MPSSADAEASGGTGRAWWLAGTALLGLGALAGVAATPAMLDWQQTLAGQEPWRAWSAAWIHLSGLHLAANLAGAALVGALGFVAGVPQRSVAAWFLAWPLTHFALLVRPDLAHYAGLSGVLHAGVAVVAVHLIAAARGARRAIGFALLAALSIKVASEAPWAAEALRHPAGWDIAIVPFAHASGLVAGSVASVLAEAAARWRRAYHRSR